MLLRIRNHIPLVTDSFRDILSSTLQYKIIVGGLKFANQFPDIFEQGECEYQHSLDALLDHLLVGNVGQSEMVTTSRNALFLSVFDNCCGFTVFRDQNDPSSVIRQRPDDTVMSRGALLLKNEAKADIRDEEAAKFELTSKLANDSVKVFPSGRDTVFFPYRIIIFCMKSKNITETPLQYCIFVRLKSCNGWI